MIGLREHACNVKNGRDGFVALHCSTCGCKPLFQNSHMIGKNKNRLTCEMIEAEKIGRLGPECASTPSLGLCEKELRFLGLWSVRAWQVCGLWRVSFMCLSPSGSHIRTPSETNPAGSQRPSPSHLPPCVYLCTSTSMHRQQAQLHALVHLSPYLYLFFFQGTYYTVEACCNGPIHFKGKRKMRKQQAVLY